MILNPGSFTSPRSLLELMVAKQTKQTFFVPGEVNYYTAVALTDAVPLSRETFSKMYGYVDDPGGDGTTESQDRFVIKAMIIADQIGDPLDAAENPHHMLPIPCAASSPSSTEEDLAKTMMYTTFITTESFTITNDVTIRVNDRVIVGLSVGPDGYQELGRGTIEGFVSRGAELVEQDLAGCATPLAMTFAHSGEVRQRHTARTTSARPVSLPAGASQPSAGSHELPPTADRRTLTIAEAIDNSSLTSEDVVRSTNPIDGDALRSVVERLQPQWRKPDGSLRTETEPETWSMQRAAWCHTVPRYCGDDADWGPGRSGGYRHWSGAWISYMLSLAGASTFPRSHNHNIYDEQGWYNRQNSTGNWYTYSLQTEAVAISVGDVLTYPSYCRGCTYEYGHADVVWKITENRIYTAGGNISNTMHSTMYIPYTPDPVTGEAILGHEHGSSACRGCGGSAGDYVLVLKKMT